MKKIFSKTVVVVMTVLVTVFIGTTGGGTIPPVKLGGGPGVTQNYN